MAMRAIKSKSMGRLQLLEWLNAFLEADYSRVEHLKDGIAFAQILDAVNPGKLKLSRLNFNANTEDECVHNLRCVEQGLRRCKINKELPLRRLSKGSFQDTFELLQWCYNYLHTHYPDADYNYPAYDIRQKAVHRQRVRKARKAGRTDAAAAQELPTTPRNPNLVPKSYSIRPGVKKSPPKDVVLAGQTQYPSPPVYPSSRRHSPAGSPEDNYRLRSLTDEFEQMVMEASKDGFRVPSSPLPPRSSPEHYAEGAHRRRQRRARPRASMGDTDSGSGSGGGRGTHPRGARASQHGDDGGDAGDPELDELVLVLQRDLTKRLGWQKTIEQQVVALRGERDEYFEALRSVERLCLSVGRDTDVGAQLLEILHATSREFELLRTDAAQAKAPRRAEVPSGDDRGSSHDEGGRGSAHGDASDDSGVGAGGARASD